MRFQHNILLLIQVVSFTPQYFCFVYSENGTSSLLGESQHHVSRCSGHLIVLSLALSGVLLISVLHYGVFPPSVGHSLLKSLCVSLQLCRHLLSRANILVYSLIPNCTSAPHNIMLSYKDTTSCICFEDGRDKRGSESQVMRWCSWTLEKENKQWRQSAMIVTRLLETDLLTDIERHRRCYHSCQIIIVHKTLQDIGGRISWDVDAVPGTSRIG